MIFNDFLSSFFLKVKQYRQKYNKSLLFLNAGDHFQGTFWYTLNKSEVVAHFVGKMDQDEMALGNHEFDDGEVELKKFIDVMEKYQKDFKFVCANIELKSDSVLNGKIKPSVIREVNGRKVAIIGYVTPQTTYLASPGSKVKFLDEITAIQAEVDKIKKNDSSINIFIAFGHSGMERDLEIAYHIHDLDLVVGGHSHTFLWDTKAMGPSPNEADIPVREYPIVVRKNGTTSLVVQAFAFGKYMGHLDLSFDSAGKLKAYSGFPIYMNGSVDEETHKFLLDEIKVIEPMINQTVGVAAVELNNQYCRNGECPIGNYVCDSIKDLFSNKSSWQGMNSECDTVFGIFNGGSIRSSISRGIIANKDVMDALPYDNPIGLTEVDEELLWSVFEHSASQYNWGGFLQLSNNVRAKYQFGWTADRTTLYDVEIYCNGNWKSLKKSLNKATSKKNTQPFGKRNPYKVASSSGPRPRKGPVYLVAITGYLYQGGDKFTMFNRSSWKTVPETTRSAFIKFLNNGTADPKTEDRIVFGSYDDFHSSAIVYSSSAILIIFLSILSFFA